MITRAKDGWTALRLAVFKRDEGCLSKSRKAFGHDVATDECRDEWGNIIVPTLDFHKLEFDHVKEEIGDPKPDDDEAHGVGVCPWHHRLSNRWRIDSKKHRAQVRDYLLGLYPEVWLDV